MLIYGHLFCFKTVRMPLCAKLAAIPSFPRGRGSLLLYLGRFAELIQGNIARV